MSRWDADERFTRAVFVARQYPADISLLDAIAHYSRADPFELEVTNGE
ncbi:hypothetical protein [Halorubrum sp. HHNYT27]